MKKPTTNYQVPSTKPVLVAIVGETASGKSALAMDIARQFGGELVCADAWTVYRGFDIGTAKPTAADRAAVPHHVLDVTDPLSGFNAAVFKGLAEQAIEAIAARGKLPILVGGSGLYVDSVLYNYSFLPTASSQERQILSTMPRDALVALAELRGIDLSKVDIYNKRRVIRCIENNGNAPQRSALRPRTLVLGLRVSKDDLRQRAEQRVDAMLARGLAAEAITLATLWGWDCEPMKGVGYREWQAYAAGSHTMAETRENIVRGTMQLAKKQRTWFRRNNSIQWLDDRSNAVEIVTTFLNK